MHDILLQFLPNSIFLPYLKVLKGSLSAFIYGFVLAANMRHIPKPEVTAEVLFYISYINNFVE